MTTAIALAPAQKLVTHTGKAFFRLGLLVEDSDGRRFGLTARHILDSENDDRVYDASTTELVGRRVAAGRTGRSERMLSDTIGLIELDRRASINLSDPLSCGLTVLSPERAIGRSLMKVERGGRRVPAVGVGYGGSISLGLPGRSEAVYHDVLEITFDGVSGDPVASGEAGSLILDAAGAAVGLMIAGDRHACYVAPLLPILHDRALSTLRGSTGSSSSQKGDDDLDEADVLEELSTDYRSALAGAEQLRSDLRGTSGVASDPYDEPVPQRFLDLIDAD